MQRWQEDLSMTRVGELEVSNRYYNKSCHSLSNVFLNFPICNLILTGFLTMLFSDRCTVTVPPEVNILTTDRRKPDSISSFETTLETDPPPSLTFIKTIGRTR